MIKPVRVAENPSRSARTASKVPCKPSPSIKMPNPSRIAHEEASAARKVAGRRTKSVIQVRLIIGFDDYPLALQELVTISFRGSQRESLGV